MSFGLLLFLFEFATLILILCAYWKDRIQVITIAISIAIICYYIYLFRKRISILGNLYNLFPGIGCIYLLTYPFLKYVLRILNYQIRAVSDSDVLKATLYGGTFLLLYCAISIVNQTRINNYIDNDFECIYHNICISFNNVIIDAVFFAFFILSFLLYKQTGGYDAVASGVATRVMVREIYSRIRIYNYLEYAFISYTIYSIYAFLNKKVDNINKIVSFFRVCFIVIYWMLQLLVGNRRGFIYVILGLTLYYSTNHQFEKRNIIKTSLLMLLCIGLLGALLYISILRDSGAMTTEIRIRNFFGEFINPMTTCYFYVGNSSDLLYGFSYLMVFTAFIPRAVWALKPLSLSNQFMLDYGTRMGYAYTPFTELYRNFGILYPILGLIIYHQLMYRITKGRLKYPILYLSVYVEIVNFFRGEFASSSVELMILYITFKVMYLVNKSGK